MNSSQCKNCINQTIVVVDNVNLNSVSGFIRTQCTITNAKKILSQKCCNKIPRKFIKDELESMQKLYKSDNCCSRYCESEVFIRFYQETVYNYKCKENTVPKML